MNEDQYYDDLSQKHLASIKRDTRVSLEDAAVRTIHKMLEPEQEPDCQATGVCVRSGLYVAQQEQEQEQERNFCPRCGKRLMSALGPVSIHTCCPPTQYSDIVSDGGLDPRNKFNGRTFDDYGNKIA